MLYHKQCISQIPQTLQCRNQLIVVSLMQSDTWLIQNIRNPNQTGTDLGRQTDTLRFSTGQGSCRTR